MHDRENGIHELWVRSIDSPTLNNRWTEYGDDGKVRYIEARNNERFKILVQFGTRFKTESCSHFRVKVSFDGGAVTTEKTFGIGRALPAHGPVIVDEAMYQKDNIKKWFGFRLQPLEYDPMINLSPTDDHEQLLNRGRIDVSIQRGRSRVRRLRTGGIRPTEPQIPTSKTSKGVLKKKSHCIEPYQTKRANASPRSTEYYFVPADGESGKPYTFTFFYASKEILQRDGIIPKPSPPLLVSASLNPRQLPTALGTPSTVKAISTQAQATPTTSTAPTNTPTSSKALSTPGGDLISGGRIPKTQLATKSPTRASSSFFPTLKQPSTAPCDAKGLENCDDEEPLPPKKMKVEPIDLTAKDKPVSSPGATRPSQDSAVEPKETKAETKAGTEAKTFKDAVAAAAAKLAEAKKKRARLIFDLEEAGIEQRQLKIRRQLMELEGEDGGA